MFAMVLVFAAAIILINFLLCPVHSARTAPLLFLLIASDIDPVAGKDCVARNVLIRFMRQCQLWDLMNSNMQDLILPLLPAFSEMFNLPVNVSVTTDAEMVSFDSIQLSAQGSERQKKDVPGWKSAMIVK